MCSPKVQREQKQTEGKENQQSRNVNVVDKAVIQRKIVGIKLPSVSIVERGDTMLNLSQVLTGSNP